MTGAVNFDFTDDQQAIKRTAHDFLAARYKPETMRELAADERGFTDEQWRQLAELGWPGVVVPEDARRPRTRRRRAGRDPGGDGLRAGAVAVLLQHLRGAAAGRGRNPTSSARAGWRRWRRRELRGTLAVWDADAGWSPDHSEVESAGGTLSAHQDRGSRRGQR